MSISKTKLILKCRKDLIDIHRHALEGIKPERLVRDRIQVSNGSLIVKYGTDQYSSYNLANTRIHVVGGGKSVMAMAMGLADVAQHSHIQSIFSHGRLSVPVGLETSICEKTLDSINVKCSFGSKNNLPDQDSVDASKNILQSITDACDSDLAQGKSSFFIVLISGGGSACLTSPRYLSLSKKLEIIKFLVQKGADIVELNRVRRFYSNIKGGGLARYILSKNPRSRILSLILSDVIGDPIEFIASGPTYLDSQQTVQLQRDQALQVLSRYGYPFPVHRDIHNDHSDHMDVTNLVNCVIGNNKLAIDSATNKAQLIGYEVINLGSCLQGDTRSVVEKLVRSAHESFNKSEISQLLVIGGGEATVKKSDNETWGKGGRAQEMALDYLISRLSANQPVECEDTVDMILTGTTDGQDGPTDVGACLASFAGMLNDSSERQIRLEEALQAKISHNSYNFWRTFKPDWLIKTGLTGTNVMDLYMYSLTRASQQPTQTSRL